MLVTTLIPQRYHQEQFISRYHKYSGRVKGVHGLMYGIYRDFHSGEGGETPAIGPRRVFSRTHRSREDVETAVLGKFVCGSRLDNQVFTYVKITQWTVKHRIMC